jgi:hypothetical protein
MSLVIDASLTVTWYFDDETTPATEAILDRVAETGAIVPTLWRLEVANAFQSAIRRQRVRSEPSARLQGLGFLPDCRRPQPSRKNWDFCRIAVGRSRRGKDEMLHAIANRTLDQRTRIGRVIAVIR